MITLVFRYGLVGGCIGVLIAVLQTWLGSLLGTIHFEEEMWYWTKWCGAQAVIGVLAYQILWILGLLKH